MNGLLLVNLGTPDEPTPEAVRRYLREFLSDPRVLDINPIGRALLLHAIILPFRPKKSAAAYQKVWTDKGSPLLAHSADLREGVAEALRLAHGSDAWHVELAMRYGHPSIPRALDRLQEAGVTRLVVFPLYPQYAASSTGTTLERVMALIGSRWNIPELVTLGDFFDDPEYIGTMAALGRDVLDEFSPDHVLLSFHGLPERHVRKSDPSGQHCLTKEACCSTIGPHNRFCYRAQCVATTHALTQALALEPSQWTLCFQSRLGRTPWIQPYTDIVIPELARAGKKRLAVFCPAFVADCLETLEEIGIRAREQFLECGGEDLRLVPALNAHPRWARAIVDMLDARIPSAPVRE